MPALVLSQTPGDSSAWANSSSRSEPTPAAVCKLWSATARQTARQTRHVATAPSQAQRANAPARAPAKLDTRRRNLPEPTQVATTKLQRCFRACRRCASRPLLAEHVTAVRAAVAGHIWIAVFCDDGDAAVLRVLARALVAQPKLHNHSLPSSRPRKERWVRVPMADCTFEDIVFGAAQRNDESLGKPRSVQDRRRPYTLLPRQIRTGCRRHVSRNTRDALFCDALSLTVRRVST